MAGAHKTACAQGLPQDQQRRNRLASRRRAIAPLASPRRAAAGRRDHPDTAWRTGAGDATDLGLARRFAAPQPRAGTASSATRRHAAHRPAPGPIRRRTGWAGHPALRLLARHPLHRGPTGPGAGRTLQAGRSRGRRWPPARASAKLGLPPRAGDADRNRRWRHATATARPHRRKRRGTPSVEGVRTRTTAGWVSMT